MIRSIERRWQLGLLAASGLGAVLAVVAIGQEKAPELARLGKVQFKVACSDKAQQTFNRAMALYHSFAWKPAADTFATSSFNFSLAIYENGEFEVIYSSGRKATPVKATVGMTNADGQLAILAAGPTMDFPAVGYGGDDDQGFRFKPVVK